MCFSISSGGGGGGGGGGGLRNGSSKNVFPRNSVRPYFDILKRRIISVSELLERNEFLETFLIVRKGQKMKKKRLFLVSDLNVKLGFELR